MKIVLTLMTAALIGLPAVAHAEFMNYPPCADDPDVTCYDSEGTSKPTYESGQYPEEWYEARYENDKPNEFRQAEITGKTYVAPVQETYTPYVEEAVEPEPVTVYEEPAGPPVPPRDETADMFYALIYS